MGQKSFQSFECVSGYLNMDKNCLVYHKLKEFWQC